MLLQHNVRCFFRALQVKCLKHSLCTTPKFTMSNAAATIFIDLIVFSIMS